MKDIIEYLKTKLEWIDEFLREFSDFLSNDSLARLGIYKQALKECLGLLMSQAEKKAKKSSK